MYNIIKISHIGIIPMDNPIVSRTGVVMLQWLVQLYSAYTSIT